MFVMAVFPFTELNFLNNIMWDGVKEYIPYIMHVVLQFTILTVRQVLSYMYTHCKLHENQLQA